MPGSAVAADYDDDDDDDDAEDDDDDSGDGDDSDGDVVMTAMAVMTMMTRCRDWVVAGRPLLAILVLLRAFTVPLLARVHRGGGGQVLPL